MSTPSCCTPCRPWTTVGVLTQLASLGTVITAVSLPFFIADPLGGGSHAGAFQECDGDNYSSFNGGICQTIPTDCSLIPDSITGYSTQQKMIMESCPQVNAIRATLLIGMIGQGITLATNGLTWFLNNTGNRGFQLASLFSSLFWICNHLTAISVFAGTYTDFVDSWGVSFWLLVGSTASHIIGAGCFYKGCTSEGPAAVSAVSGYAQVYDQQVYPQQQQLPAPVHYPGSSAYSSYWTLQSNIPQQQQQTINPPYAPPPQPYFQYPRY